MAHWMRVGFVHGVMNTDNLSVLGLTIDYGPYGWLEDYDPNWTPNTTDAQGRRYRFGAQPQVALWNLNRFVEAIYPLIEDVKPLEAALETYIETFQKTHREMFLAKLGLQEDRGDTDTELIQRLLQCLQISETDMTIFFRRLAAFNCDAPQKWHEIIEPAFYDTADFKLNHQETWQQWFSAYTSRLKQERVSFAEKQEGMNQVNPKYVMRNYLAQLAIDQAEKGDGSGVRDLLAVMRQPYAEQPNNEKYAEKRPEWARHRVGCSMLSCSS